MDENNEVEIDIQDELLTLMRSELPPSDYAEQLYDYHDADIAKCLPDLTPDERLRLYKALGEDRISDVFSYIEDPEEYLQELDVEKAADILEGMDADDAIDVLETLPTEYREELVEHMDDEAVEDIELIKSYEDDEMGSLMTTNFIEIKRGSSIKQAMKELIRQSDENDNITTIYVSDADGSYYGAIELKDLIIAREGSELEAIISTSYPSVEAHAKIADEMARVRDYSEDSIPVLNEGNHIIGVITAFDVVEVVDEELGEDYAKLAGLTEAEDLKEKLGQSIRKRMPWLLILLALGLGVSTVVGLFEGVVKEIAIVVCFQSLILDMAGNSGTQTLAVTIRVLMDEQLTGRDKFFFVLKELRVGMCDGGILGLISFALVGLYIVLLKGLPAGQAFAISGCVGIALLVTTMISTLLGTLVPMLFHKLKIDPAVASGPLITTTNDLIAVITYYGLSWFLLLQVLHLAG